jgi:alkylation response protein AidB-like acyl-CoA dehydrogenase
MDFRFTKEQEMLRGTIRALIKKECPKELIREWDRRKEVPVEIIQKFKNLGLTGVSIPEKYGGTGGNAIDFCIVTEEISKVSVIEGFFAQCMGYGSIIIGDCGNEEQKQLYLPEIAKGNLLFSYGITEPNAGSDAAAARTMAVASGDNYVINGNKMFISGADVADYIVTLVRTDKSLPKHKGLTLFIIDRKLDGYSAKPLEKLGGNCLSACEVVFDNLIVPAKNILGGSGELNNGWNQFLKTLELEHIQLAAGALGGMQTSFEDALQYAKEREQFGQPIGKFQAISHLLAEMAIKIEACRWLTYHAAWLKSEKMPCFKECSISKIYTTESYRDISLQTMQIFGGYGYMMEFDAQRHLRDSLIGWLGGGTSQIHKNMIARSLGL